MAKRGLGRGIDALLAPQTQAAEEEIQSAVKQAGGVVQVPIETLIPNPHQPRKHFPEGALAELTDSIRDRGIIQPLIAEKNSENGYTIIAGERRFRAAQAAGLTEVPVVVRSFSDEEKREIALIENIQREDLSAIEEAEAYKAIMESSGINQEELASRVGKNRSTVANSLRLLNLSREARQAVEDGEMSSGHARALLSLRNPEHQSILLHEVLTEGLTVRQAEQRAKELGGQPVDEPEPDSKPPAKVSEKSPELSELERLLVDHLGTKVVIHGNDQKGRIEIAYHSIEDLEDVYTRLAGETPPSR